MQTPGLLATQLVGTRGTIKTTIRTGAAAGVVKRTYRTGAYIAADCDALQLADSGYYVTAGENNLGNSQIIEAALEIGGTTVSFTWGGGNQLGTIADGQSLLISDKLYAASFGLPNFAKGTSIWLRRCIEVPTGGNYLSVQINNPSIPGEYSVTMATGVASQVTGNGALTTTGPYTLNNDLCLPTMLLGQPLAKRHAVAGVGDSILRGSGDNNGNGINGAGGWFARGLAAMTDPLPYVNLGVVGTTIASWGSGAAITGQKRWDCVKYCSVMMSDYGINDLNSAYTPAQVLANLQNLWTRAKAAGLKYVIQSKITGKTSSTDNWLTLANQTPTAGMDVGGLPDQLNASLIANVGSNGLDQLIDFRALLFDATSTAKWAANGVTAFLMTADGTHPSPHGHGVAAPVFTTALNALPAP